jgi:uncharacterized protein
MVQAARSVNRLKARHQFGQQIWQHDVQVARNLTPGQSGWQEERACSIFWHQGAKPERKMAMVTISNDEQRDLESEVLQRLIRHLRERSEVQNIDLMTLAGFCRNCLANWYQDAAKARGRDVSRDEARAFVYGMPYEEWKSKHQQEATDSQKRGFEKARKGH